MGRLQSLKSPEELEEEDRAAQAAVSDSELKNRRSCPVEVIGSICMRLALRNYKSSSAVAHRRTWQQRKNS